MPYQNISAILTAENIAKVKDLAAQIRALLPFLQTLTSGDRIKLYKMGPQRLAWVQECLNAARNNPQVLPGTFKVEEFEKDFNLALALADLRSVFEQLFTDVDDTTMGLGSEAAQQASDLMGYIDQAADTQPGLRSVAANLHEFFKRANVAGKKTAQEKAAEAAARAAK